MSNPIPDFTETELTAAAGVLARRYGEQVDLELADSELKLDAGDAEMMVCPTLYWTRRGAQFVVFKVGVERYRCQFFYSDADQYATGRPEYDEIEDCVLTLLRVQSDHERRSSGISSGATAADLSDEDYLGPAIL